MAYTECDTCKTRGMPEVLAGAGYGLAEAAGKCGAEGTGAGPTGGCVERPTGLAHALLVHCWTLRVNAHSGAAVDLDLR